MDDTARRIMAGKLRNSTAYGRFLGRAGLPPLPEQARRHIPWAVTFLPIRRDMFAMIDARHGPYPERHETIEPILLGIQAQVEVRTMCDSYFYYYQVHARDLEPRLLARHVPPLPRVTMPPTSTVWPDGWSVPLARSDRARSC